MRKIIIAICLITILGIFAFSLPLSVGAATVSEDNSVSAIEAVTAATNQISKLSESVKYYDWKDATAGQAVNYYAPDYTQSAFEFPVIKNNSTVGYIIVSARKDWMPILTVAKGDITPSSRLPIIIAYCIKKGLLSEEEIIEPKIIYWGAGSYSVQLGQKMKQDGTAINLFEATIEPMPKQDALQMNPDSARNAWGKIQTNVKSSSKFIIASLINPLIFKPQINSYIYESVISGVPSWYQHDDAYVDTYGACSCCDEHQDGTSLPTCIGSGNDPWFCWDGCSPIAGAMVLGYWYNYGYTSIVYNDETLIDRCHQEMNTSLNGNTINWYIDDGIRDVFLYYGYSASVNNDSSVSWDDIYNEISNDRPIVLSYGGHSRTGYGCYWYTEDPDNKYIETKTTWYNNLTEDVLFGDWDSCQETKTEPE